MFGSFPLLRALWLVCASKVYSGLGADIVMESITPITHGPAGTSIAGEALVPPNGVEWLSHFEGLCRVDLILSRDRSARHLSSLGSRWIASFDKSHSYKW